MRIFVKTYFLPFASLFLFINLTILIYFEIDERAGKRDEKLFNLKINQLQSTLERRFGYYIQILKSGKAFLAISDQVSPEEWYKFYQILSLDKNFPGIQGLGYAEYLSQSNRRQFEETVIAEGLPDYKIIPEGERHSYVPIRLLEPLNQSNLRAIGFDMFSEPVRRKAMEHARDTRMPTISGKVTLVQESEKDPQAGFLIYIPIYHVYPDPATLEERRRELKGFVYAPFRTNDFIHSVLRDEFPDLNISIYDGESMSPEALIFTTQAFEVAQEIPAKQFQKITSLYINGKVWTILTTVSPEFFGGSRQPILFLTGGILISFLMFAVLLSLAKTRESDLLKQAITDNATAALFMINKYGICIFMNPAAEEMTGYTLIELKDRPLHEMLHQPRAGGAEAITDPALDSVSFRKRDARVYEDIFYKKDGSAFRASCAARAVYSNGITVVATLVEVNDVTKEKIAQEVLQKQAHILNSMSEGVSLSNEHGTILFTNPAEDVMFGYERGELIGKNVAVQNTYSPEKHQEFLDKIVEDLKRKGFWLGEINNIKKDGALFVTRARINSLTMSDDRYWICVQEDITHEKRVQRTIQENAAKLGESNKTLRILNEVGASISSKLDIKTLSSTIIHATAQISGADFGIFFIYTVNEASEIVTTYALSGIAVEDFVLLEEDNSLFSPYYSEVAVLMSGDITNDQRIGIPKPFVPTKAGVIEVKSYLTVPVISRNGQLIGRLILGHTGTNIFNENTVSSVVGIAAQATIAIDNARLYEASELDRKELLRFNLELEKKNQELLRINNDLDSFVYTASHDLKSPISNIEGLILLLNKKIAPKLSSGEQKIIDHMHQSISKFKTTIMDLSDISRVQKNLDSEKTPLAFEEILDQVQADIQNLLNNADVKIKSDFKVSHIVYAKRNLRSIIYNLLSNAIKYRSYERDVEVEIKTYLTESHVVLSVKDNGLGIAKDQEHKLFTMFKRIHTHVEGSGIGLYIVKRIVENNDGFIEVSTTEGIGTEFRIFFKK